MVFDGTARDGVSEKVNVIWNVTDLQLGLVVRQFLRKFQVELSMQERKRNRIGTLKRKRETPASIYCHKTLYLIKDKLTPFCVLQHPLPLPILEV